MLSEKRTSEKTTYAVETQTGKVREQEGAKGTPLPAIKVYKVANRRLCARECVADAEEILFQGRRGDVDVVVIRKEYNSIANPLRLLGALIGHPVQVSSIRVVLVRGEGVTQTELVRKPASYDWEASIVQ